VLQQAIAAELQQSAPVFNVNSLRAKMKEKFPNAGLSHDEKVEAGAAVFGDAAATYAQEVVRLLEIQTGILNNLYQVAKTTETVLTSGRASSVAHSLKVLEASKRKKKIPSPMVVGESDPEDSRVDTNDKENIRPPSTINGKTFIPDTYEDEDATQPIIEEVDQSLSQSSVVSVQSAHSSMPPLSYPSPSLDHSQQGLPSSPGPKLSLFSSSHSTLFSARKTPSTSSSMVVEAANIPEKLKKTAKVATTKQPVPTRKRKG
jgi:hypothetical protein